MQLTTRHPWRLSPERAVQLQRQMAGQVCLADDLDEVHSVAGVDVGFEDSGRTTRAAVVVLEYPGLELVETALARSKTVFPYIPGLLSFRELPAVLRAMKKLKTLPDLILCDGQGYAHPRRFGIACHLGRLTGIPSIGVGKTRLLGEYTAPEDRRGAWSPLHDRGEIVGAVLRTRVQVKPLFISQGHRVSLETAIDYVMAATTRFRLPETTRRAHRLASA